MHLNPKAFDGWLAGNIGQSFTWRKAYRCPCVNPNSGAAKPGCPICHGKAWTWVAAVPGPAGMSGQQTQLRWAQMGMWQDGDAVVTIPESSPLYEMGQFDRVIMLNSTDYFSLPLVHGVPNEVLREPIEKITRVFWLDPTGTTIIEGGIPTVNADGTLTWATSAPPAGVTYSITGTRYSEYYCWGPYPSDRNEHFGARLPKRVVLRRFDLFGRAGVIPGT